MKKYIPLFLILILATLLRFYHNLDVSMWHDEAFSALMIRYPWHEMIVRLGLDVHPPMYYIFLRVWHYIFGDSLLSLRGFSIFFGVGTVWAGYLFTKEAFKNEKAALWAAVFIAINPLQLLYVSEARMYQMGGFFALLAAYFLVRALHLQKEKMQTDTENQNMPNLPGNINANRLVWLNYLGFTLSMVIIIYTHYYLFFTAAALGFYGVLYLYFHHGGGKKKWIPLLLSFIVIALSFLPWLKTFSFQYKQVGRGYWIPQMDIWSIPSTFWDMLLGFARNTAKYSTDFWLVMVTLFSLWMLYRFVKKTQDFAKWLVVLAVIAPFAGAILFAILAHLKGSKSSVYLDRYFLYCGLYFSIALAVWMKEISKKWLSVALFCTYCILNIFAYFYFWNALNVKAHPGMSAANKFLQANVQSKDKIFVSSSSMFFNFKYYWTKPAGPEANENTDYDTGTNYTFVTNVRPKLRIQGITELKDVPHYYGSALLTDKDFIADFNRATNPGDTVWLVWTNGFYESKPSLPLNWTQVDELTYPEVRPLYSGINVYVTEYKVN
jgi:4-amino-4-deoxy-L-arabinose transferase-like glycosyltransferase